MTAKLMQSDIGCQSQAALSELKATVDGFVWKAQRLGERD